MRPKQIEKIVIPQVSASTKNAIKRKTAFNLPDRPSDMGMKPAEIKAAFWAPVIDETFSAIAELDRVIRDINEAFDEIVYPPFVDGEGAYSVIQEDAEKPENNSNNAYADNSLSLGRRTTAGSKAFKLIGYNAGAKTYTLDSTEGIEIGDYYSIYFYQRQSRYGKITAVDTETNTITVDDFFISNVIPGGQHDFYLALAYVYIVGKPELGTLVIGDAAVASGEGCIAAEAYSDAGGENNVSDGKFSFTRGKSNVTGYCGATFGIENINLADKGFMYGHKGYSGPYIQNTFVGGSKCEAHTGEQFITGVENKGSETVWAQALFGKYAKETSALFAIGNGASDSNRNNAFAVFPQGFAEVYRVLENKQFSVVNVAFAKAKNAEVLKVAKEYADNNCTPRKRAGSESTQVIAEVGRRDENGNIVSTTTLIPTSYSGYNDALARYSSNGRLRDKGTGTWLSYAFSELPNKGVLLSYLNDGTGGYLNTVKKTVDDRINAFATEVSENGAIDKFAELVAYVETHGGEAAKMGAAITELEERYAGIEQKHAADVVALTASLDKKAAEGHDHDEVYAAKSHDHEGVYSPAGHNHDEVYATKEELENAALSEETRQIIFDLQNDVSVLKGNGTIGLNYVLSTDGTYFDCTGIGGAVYSDVVIANNVKGKPVLSIRADAFQGCTSLTSAIIPDIVKTIGANAFRSCTRLTSITIPSSVTSIGNSAFSVCKSLTSITIPGSVTSIERQAFDNCTNLTSITILNGVTSIELQAFYACINLTSITIPSSVTSIAQGAFDTCPRLTDVYYRGTKAEWDAIAIGTYNENLTNATIHYNS